MFQQKQRLAFCQPLSNTLSYLLEAAIKFIIINSLKIKPLLLDHLAEKNKLFSSQDKIRKQIHF